MNQSDTAKLKKKVLEVKRDENYTEKVATKITKEVPHKDNPYHAQEMFVYGYKHTDLVEKRSFVDMLFLLFQGELPNKQQENLFEKIMCCLINPGPRYPGTRAAMNAGVARTKIDHVLPISLAVSSGNYLGSEDIFNCMKFMQKNINADPVEVASELYEASTFDAVENPVVLNGFGSYFGSADNYTKSLLDLIKQHNPEGRYLHFADAMVRTWSEKEPAIGWLITGLASAVFCDLGFRPRHGSLLFQICISPGLAAHGVEKASQPATAMPFTSEDKFMLGENFSMKDFQPTNMLKESDQ